MTRASTTPDRLKLDAHVGARIKARRKELGQTQWLLAELIGMSWQQLQKYERGTNRISVALLQDIAKAQGVEIGHYVAAFEPHAEATPGSLSDPLRLPLNSATTIVTSSDDS